MISELCNMQKNIFILIFISGILNFTAQAQSRDRNYENGKLKAELRYKRHFEMGCEAGAERWFKFAFNLSNSFHSNINSTQPKSAERNETINLFKKKMEQLADEDYINFSNMKKEYIRKITATDMLDREIEISSFEFYIHGMNAARMETELNIIKNPGKSEMAYKRAIEEDCKRSR